MMDEYDRDEFIEEVKGIIKNRQLVLMLDVGELNGVCDDAMIPYADNMINAAKFASIVLDGILNEIEQIHLQRRGEREA